MQAERVFFAVLLVSLCGFPVQAFPIFRTPPSFAGAWGAVFGKGRSLLNGGDPCYGEFTDSCIGQSPDCCVEYDNEKQGPSDCAARVRPEQACGSYTTVNDCVRQVWVDSEESSGWECDESAQFKLAGGSVANDPVMTGFDAKKFLFEELGEFPLLHEGGGWRVNATFSPVPMLKPGVDPKERSFTSEVKVQAPNGDVVSCALPTLTPNTTRVEMRAVPASSGIAQSLSPAALDVTMDQMKASGGLTWKTTPSGEWYSYIVSCEIETQKMNVTVYQVSGWEEAQAKPEEHGWAAPFTWLNVGFQIFKPLDAPVTGVLGDTYPKAETAQPGAVLVEGGGSGEGGAATVRRLLTPNAPLLSAGVSGL